MHGCNGSWVNSPPQHQNCKQSSSQKDAKHSKKKATVFVLQNQKAFPIGNHGVLDLGLVPICSTLYLLPACKQDCCATPNIHPEKLTWQWKNDNLSRCISYSNRWFSLVMLVFWGVYFKGDFLELPQDHPFRRLIQSSMTSPTGGFFLSTKHNTENQGHKITDPHRSGYIFENNIDN